MTSPNIEIEVYKTDKDVYIVLAGRIVLEECERLRSLCMPLIQPGIEQVVVDLARVSFVDSAGLGVLVGLKMTAGKHRSRIVLVQPSRPVADILYISKLDGIFDIQSGADAEVLRSQMVLPANRAGDAAAGDVSEPAMPSADQKPITGSEPRVESSSATLRSPKDVIEEHCRKAVEAMRQGNYEVSVEAYRQALALDPEYLPALNNLAIVYEKLPSWIPKAIECWEEVLRLSQSHGDQKHIDRAQRHLASLRKMSV